MKKRYLELDILRAMAIMGVLLIHISGRVIPSNNGMIEDIALFINQSSRFAVPVFLILSGWGLTISNSLKDGYLSFVRKRILKIVILYIIWSIIYYTATVNSFDVIDFIKRFILGSNYYHLYYVPLIIIFYLIYPWVLKIGKSNLGLIFILVITILSQEADIITGIDLFNNAKNIFNWIFFFALGSWLANDYDSKIEKLQKYRLIIIVLFITTLSAVFFESYLSINKIGKEMSTTSMRPSIIMLSVLFLTTFLSINWKDSFLIKPLLNLSTLAYGVYLSHALILSIFDKVYVKLGFSMESVLYIVTAFIVVLFMSILVTIVLNKIISVIGSKFQSNGSKLVNY